MGFFVQIRDKYTHLHIRVKDLRVSYFRVTLNKHLTLGKTVVFCHHLLSQATYSFSYFLHIVTVKRYKIGSDMQHWQTKVVAVLIPLPFNAAKPTLSEVVRTCALSLCPFAVSLTRGQGTRLEKKRTRKVNVENVLK